MYYNKSSNEEASETLHDLVDDGDDGFVGAASVVDDDFELEELLLPATVFRF